MPIEPIPFVPSSNIKAAAYDAATLTLWIRFTRGQVYKYVGVPSEVASGMSNSMSAGQYLRTFIDTQYNGQLVTDEDLPESLQ